MSSSEGNVFWTTAERDQSGKQGRRKEGGEGENPLLKGPQTCCTHSHTHFAALMEDFFKRLASKPRAVPLDECGIASPVAPSVPAARAAPAPAPSPPSSVLFEVVQAPRDMAPTAPRRRSAHESLFSGKESVACSIAFASAPAPADSKGQALLSEDAIAWPTNSLVSVPTCNVRSKWDTDLWIDACSPSSWDMLSAFVVDHVTRMETGDRAAAARPDDETSKVMASLNASVTAWKAGKGKPHCLIGGVNTGKTTMLRLLADRHGFEFVPIHEDAPDALKEVLQFAGDKGLDTRPRLWAVEHYDMFDRTCKALLRPALARLQRSGPVFLTAWPSVDLRTLQSFAQSTALAWTFPARLAFLDRFGPSEFEWNDAFADAGGDLGRAMVQGQFARSTAAPVTSSALCSTKGCTGGCSLCMARRRVPSNPRLLVEDTLCLRSSAAKRSMLAESDVDLHAMLLQEMIPLAASSLESMLKGLDAMSLMDATSEYSTMVKDAFVGGTVQNVCASSQLGFNSGSTLPIPKCLFGKHRATPAASSALERRVLVARGVPHPRLRSRLGLTTEADGDSDSEPAAPASKKRVRAAEPKRGSKKGSAALVVLENDAESTDDTDIAWSSPQCDTRDFSLEVSLFEQAAGRVKGESK